MPNWYRQANRRTMRWLWCLVILGIVASIPLAYHRVTTENTSNNVEFVFNYRNLLEMSDYKANPRQFVEEQLTLMKQAGITSMAVNESTLDILKLSRRIELFSSHEAAALVQVPISPNENFTYILFSEKESENEIKNMIEKNFQRLNIKLRPWSFNSQNGLVIEMPIADAALLPMDPDPITLKMLKSKGFNLLVSLSNHRSLEEIEDVLKELDQFDVKSIMIDGDAVPGYSNNEKTDDISLMANLLNKHNLGVAFVEMQSADPKGFDILAKKLNHNVFRAHNFSEIEANKLMENVTLKELDNRIQRLSDRFVLAVKDRNIRMILLNGLPSKSNMTGMYTDPLPQIYSILDGQDGAVQRIQDLGFTIGPAHSFIVTNMNMYGVLKLLAVLGSVSLIAIMLSLFVPTHLLSISILGFLGAGGIGILSSNLLYKMLALGVAISGPSLAIMIAINWLRKQQQHKKTAVTPWYAFLIYLCASCISLIAGLFIVALLDNVAYFLLIDQFIGVSIVSSIPIFLAALYLVFFSEALTAEEKILKAKRLLLTPISVLWVICGGIALVFMLYYLSRTGNSGSVSGLELFFRALLENTIGIRPRNKEFLFAHPLFILGAYLALKHKPCALYILALGVIGQASLVDTFAHLHTPLHITIIRVIYGLVLGSLFSFLYLWLWNVIEKIWGKWAPSRGLS